MKKPITLLISALLALSFIAVPSPAYAASYDFSSFSDMGSIVYEMNSGDVIIQNNPDTRYYPGSITKLLTAVTALDYLSLTDEITVTQEMLDLVEANSSVADLEAGEKLTVEQLLYALLLPSGNDASKVLAISTGSKILNDNTATIKACYTAFVSAMNSKAKTIGMTASNFVNSDGYDDTDNYSTPRDLILLGQSALKVDVIKNICASKYQYVETNKTKHYWYSTNLFLYSSFDGLTAYTENSGENPYYDSRISGMKTGYTDIGGRCFLFYGESEGLKLIGVVMNVPAENSDLIWNRCSSVVDFSFDHFTVTPLITEDNNDFSYKISNHGFFSSWKMGMASTGNISACVDKTLVDGITMTVEPVDTIAEMKSNGKLKLLTNVQKGDTVAYAVFSSGDTVVKKVALLAQKNALKAAWYDYALFVISGLLILGVIVRIFNELRHKKIKRIKRKNGRKAVKKS